MRLRYDAHSLTEHSRFMSER